MGIVESRRAIGEREGLDSASDAMRSEAKRSEAKRRLRRQDGQGERRREAKAAKEERHRQEGEEALRRGIAST